MMKLVYCFLLICLTAPSAAPVADLAVGAKAGLSSPHYSGDDYRDWLNFQEQDFTARFYYDYDFQTCCKAGLSAGVFLTVGLGSHFALQQELLFTAAGGAYGYEETDYYYALTMTDKLRILELPLLAVGRLRRERTEVRAFVGPAPCLRLGQVEIRIEEGGYIAGAEWTGERFARLFLNLVCGGGLVVYLHGGNFITLDTRASLSLTPVMNSSETGLESWRQYNIQVLAGFGRLLTGQKSLRSRLR